MEQGKKMRLEAKGWKVGSAAKFLELTPEEAAEIDRRLETGRQQGADDPRSSGGERGRAAREG